MNKVRTKRPSLQLDLSGKLKRRVINLIGDPLSRKIWRYMFLQSKGLRDSQAFVDVEGF
jgi:hypothetical protein